MARYISDQNQLGFFYESGTYANASGGLQWIGEVREHTPDEEINMFEILPQACATIFVLYPPLILGYRLYRQKPQWCIVILSILLFWEWI